MSKGNVVNRGTYTSITKTNNLIQNEQRTQTDNSAKNWMP